MFVRGEAYLAARRGGEAAAEFQKILNHRGLILNQPIGALAHLGLGRAYVLQCDTVKAKAAYQDFLTLWKGADPDIPVLRQAKAEFAKLRVANDRSSYLATAVPRSLLNEQPALSGTVRCGSIRPCSGVQSYDQRGNWQFYDQDDKSFIGSADASRSRQTAVR